MLRIDPLNPSLDARQPKSDQRQRPIPHSDHNPFTGAGQLREIYRLRVSQPVPLRLRPANGDLIMADVGQNTIEEIDRVTIGGNYGWAVKEGTFLFNRTTGPGGTAGTVGADSPGLPAGPDRSDLRHAGNAGVRPPGRHLDHRRLCLPRHGDPRAGRQVRLRRPCPARAAHPRRWPAVLRRPADRPDQGVPAPAIRQRPVLPNGLTVHGFGQDGNGELYAMVTNTPANGTGGIVYKLAAFVPEPASGVLLLFSRLAWNLLACRVGRRGN